MKKLNLLTPILGIVASTGAIVPIASCACNNTKTIDLTNNQIRGANLFGASGNFNAGTNYEFSADLSKWDSEHNKPTEWGSVTSVLFTISSSQTGGTIAQDAIDISQVKISVDGTVLTRDDEGMGAGKWAYYYSSEEQCHTFSMAVENGSPIKTNSKVILSNIKFKSNFENAAICLDAVAGK